MVKRSNFNTERNRNMTKLSNAFLRAGTSTWFCKINGKQKQLAPKGASEADARAAWEILRLKLAAQDGRADELVKQQSVGNMVAIYLDAVKTTVEPTTLAHKTRVLYDFAHFYEGKTLTELTPIMVRTWVESHRTWGPSSQSDAYKVVSTYTADSQNTG